MRRIAMAVLGMALIAGSASAQTTAGSSYVEGLGGLTFGTDKTSATIGGEYGYNLNERLTVYGNVSHAFNVLSGDQADIVSVFCPTDCDPKVSATFVTGGVKYYFPTSSGLRPYAAGGVGFARLKFSADKSINDILDRLDIDRSETKGLFEIGGGLELPVGTNTKVDVGYRLAKIFQDDTDPVHRIYGGFGWTF